MMRRYTGLAFLALATLGAMPCSGGTINQVGGTYASWPSTWTPLTGVNDANDGLSRTQLDFVGDSANPGGYWASDANYVYFRMRVAAPTVVANTYSDTLTVLIDLPGMDSANPNNANYGFAWDSKSGNNTQHGLEMQIPSIKGQQWQNNRMGDIDGSDGQKLANDINGNSRVGDGYVRTIDGQSTANLGNTSFVDVAVAWDYLQNPAKGNTQLSSTNLATWRIAFASIPNATDHNSLTGDISGGANPSSLVSVGWAAVPEPFAATSLGIAASCLLLGRRSRSVSDRA